MMSGKTIVITGASDGIGAAAAKILKEKGHDVIIVGRNPEKTEKVAASLSAPFHTVDYADLQSVVRLAKELSRYPKIDVLANNAGGAGNKRTITVDGFERTFQINVLGGFLLTRLLADKLCDSGATVVQTSSIASNLYGAGLDVNDLQNEKSYSPFTAYGRAKLCDILFTRGLDKRYRSKGINAVAFEPGVVRTNFAAESTPFVRFCYRSPIKHLFTISPERSAARLVRLAEGEAGKDFLAGEVYSGKKPMRLRFKDENGEAADILWNSCVEMTDKYV